MKVKSIIKKNRNMKYGMRVQEEGHLSLTTTPRSKSSEGTSLTGHSLPDWPNRGLMQLQLLNTCQENVDWAMNEILTTSNMLPLCYCNFSIQ